MLNMMFEPDPKRTAAVDAGIRRALADSVAAVLLEVERNGICIYGNVFTWRGQMLRCAAPASLWACYHELVQAIVRLDEGAVAAIASELLAALPAVLPVPGTVVTLTAEDLGRHGVTRYIAVIDNDHERPLTLVPATRAEVARITALTVEARKLLAETSPALLDEIDTLGHEIVLATSGGARGFGGAATVFLWGAVMLNPTLVPDRVTLVEGLAHETAHALLFGLTLGADLTTNDPNERYSSPLRPDPRPIEGIVHATYVLARMIFALDQIKRSQQLSCDEQALIACKIEKNLKNYAAGLETILAYASFTEEGGTIFSTCKMAMDDRRTSTRF